MLSDKMEDVLMTIRLDKEGNCWGWLTDDEKRIILFSVD